MKRELFLSLFLVAMLPIWPQASDTIEGRCHRYYYDDWYDECLYYTECPPARSDRNWFRVVPLENIFYHGHIARRFTVPHRMAIGGLIVMGDMEGGLPEYVKIYQYDTGAPGNTVLLDSARWDTASTKVMKLPQCTQTMNLGDSSKFMYVTIREVHLEKIVEVDSVFFIAGTAHNDSEYRQQVNYSIIRPLVPDDCYPCLETNFLFRNENPNTDEWQPIYNLFSCGPFLAIKDSTFYHLTVVSDSLAMGGVDGGGYFTPMSRVSINAVPNPGYRFAMWSDGITANPRMVEINSDTLFTALFADENKHVVSLAADPTYMGSVSGGGIYSHGQTALLQATPSSHLYHFNHWNDGDSNNPRAVVVDRDTFFTALFYTPSSIDTPEDEDATFSLSPNPAHNSVTLTVTGEGSYSVSLFDNAGRTLSTTSFTGTEITLDTHNLMPGTYHVKILSPQGQFVKTFVKQ